MSFGDALKIAEDRMRAKARLKVHMQHPEVWAREVLRNDDNPDGMFLWSKQIDIANSLVENSYTAVKSCHGSGKSHSAAVFVCWFVATRLALTGNPNSVYVITTAPTYAQVHKVLWESIRAFHAMGNLPGYITTQDEWKIVTEDGRTVELASGRKPSDTDTNGFQGIHRDHLMIVLDEANGIREELFRGAVSMLTGDMSQQKMLAIGNPDDPNSLFGQEDSKDRKRISSGKSPFWNWIKIRAWDTPNFTGEEVPERVSKAVLSKDWVERARMQWREDDARWISKILAEFPQASTDSMFPVNLLEQARENEPDPTWKITANTLGVDLARMGDDRSVVMHNVDGVVKLLDSWTKLDTVESAQRIDKLARQVEARQVRVDVGAFGWAVVDMLRRLAVNSGGMMDYQVVKMDGSAKSPDAKKWRNARAFWYDSLKQQMMLNALQIPDVDELDLELRAIRYFITKDGALQIEEKAEIKKRLEGKSTDYADAAIYATADLDMYIEEDQNKPQDGETSVLDFGQELLLRQLTGGFSVSPV